MYFASVRTSAIGRLLTYLDSLLPTQRDGTVYGGSASLFGASPLEQAFELAQLVVNACGDSPFFSCTLQSMQLDVENNIAKCSTGREELEISFNRLPFPSAAPWPALLAKVGKEHFKSGSIAGFNPHFDLCRNGETNEFSKQIRAASAADSQFAI